MTEGQSRWQTQELATTFLEGVRGAIPGADLQMAIIGKIVELWCGAPEKMLDLGCGDGILGRYLLNRFPAAQGIFVDFSEPMLGVVRQKVQGMNRVAVQKADFGDRTWLLTLASEKPLDVVISGYAIHHQPDERKREIYAEVYDLLRPGGVFLNLEHVSSGTVAGEQLFDEFFIDHLYEFHAQADPAVDRSAIAAKYYQRPDKTENILAPVEQQCDWLRQIGYRDVDCFFKTFELALFGGRK